MIILNEKDVVFSEASMVDEAGRVFFYQDRVFRAIYSEEYTKLFEEILNKGWIDEIFEAGLVRTWICKDIFLDGTFLTIEHEKIPFETHPAECTSYMHWLSAKTILRISISLSKHGYLLKDAHPWNLMFNKGYPIFVDFGSIAKAEYISDSWFNEFRQYYGVPIWLASKKCSSFALEYRRQHLIGFGLKLFEVNLLKKILFNSLTKLRKHFSEPRQFFLRLAEWVDKHKPVNTKKENWADYMQSHDAEDPLMPKTIKQRFVYDLLTQEEPKKVLDCAANKGYYSEMAARLGAFVVAFDCEEFCVDACQKLAQIKDLYITPVVMDFKLPTPNYGMGLCGGSAFDRFQSDIVLALGVAHHLCITQGLPVKVFCDICLRYAKKGVLLEYVDPSDKHVMNWNKPVPKDYSLEGFTKCFSNVFPKMRQTEKITDDGICRTMVYFHK